MFNIIKKTFQYGNQQVTLETGLMARQADGAVVVTMGDTVVLVTVVYGEEVEYKGMLPYTVEYREKTSAAGKIPGGYFKREGKLSEKETLTSRLIDRPSRPLFPEGFSRDVQLIASVISLDPNVDGEIPALLGASAALAISGLPVAVFAGAKVGYRNGEFLLNPSNKDIETSQLDLIVAGTKKAVLMVESEADQLSEEVMLNAVFFGHEQMQVAIDAITEFAGEAGKTKLNWVPANSNTELKASIEAAFGDKIKSAYQVKAKTERQDILSNIRKEAVSQFVNSDNAEIKETVVKTEIENLESFIVRDQILTNKVRIDGRDLTTVRQIVPKVGVLPKTHGSALFTRGETQALVVCTLGTERDAQIIDSLDGEYRETFMLHYNFPPFSVGEIGFVGSPKRREIGHGKLAKRAIVPVLPGIENFPYVLRVVSDILESNGSSSMATVCGTSMALMDAGVPIKAPVAGIAMGLVKEDDKFAVLSDILGDEDHLGDMDFKVAGTASGVTALQMDIKIEGIDRNIMDVALKQAKDGRLHILGIMETVLSTHRGDVSQNAPRILMMQVKTDKIKDIIGKGGATIRGIVEKTGVNIDIDDDGNVKIASVSEQAGLDAKREIEMIIADAEIGKIYDGKVVKIVDFGAFVNFLPGKDGLVHISQLSEARVEKVEDILKEGQAVRVKVLDVDRQGRIKLSIKEAEATNLAS